MITTSNHNLPHQAPIYYMKTLSRCLLRTSYGYITYTVYFAAYSLYISHVSLYVSHVSLYISHVSSYVSHFSLLFEHAIALTLENVM